MVLDVSLHLADFILQLAARVFEGVVEGKCQVRMALVSGRRAPRIDLAAFRVVQEGLTNVMKHAGQARTTVRLEYRTRDLLITVSNDRPPGSGAGPSPGGRGLIGLRERIAVYGGELDAGPRPGGGWRLTARIPLEPAAGDPPVPAEFQEAST